MGRGDEGIAVQVIAQAQKECEPQPPPVGQTSFGCSIDPRRNQSDVYRRRTRDGDPFLFWLSAGPVRVSVSPHLTLQCKEQMSLSIFIVIYTSTPPLNRTTQSPYRRQTPPDHTHQVSTTACSQSQTTNLLFLLLLLLLFRCSGGTSASTPTGSSGSSAPSPTRGNLSKQPSASDQMHQHQSDARNQVSRNPQQSTVTMHTAYKSVPGDSMRGRLADSVNVLSLQLGNQLVQPLIIGLDANGREDLLDVAGSGGSVSSYLEE